eukprot:TRINITY_DN38169_c0_g1_i2.p1 TRINITY_DN38169_c0_g1~~TRINITY_DN38169_c0_g1_i2.p1  ORF type:complete len:349 (+),score=44.80 TRINITY_DN38169_c0_g1_i2:73-1047(+)
MSAARLLVASGALRGAAGPAGTRKGGGALQLWVRPPDGSAAVAVEVSADATVADLLAAANQAAPVVGDTISFQGEPLTDSSAALADVGISAEAIVELQSAGTHFVWRYAYLTDREKCTFDDSELRADNIAEATTWLPSEMAAPERGEVTVAEQGHLATSTAESTGCCDGNVMSDQVFWRGRYSIRLCIAQVPDPEWEGPGCVNVGCVLGLCTELQARNCCGGGSCMCVDPGGQWKLNVSTGETGMSDVLRSEGDRGALRTGLSWPAPAGTTVRVELDLVSECRTAHFFVNDTLAAHYEDLPDTAYRIGLSFHLPGWGVRILEGR